MFRSLRLIVAASLLGVLVLGSVGVTQADGPKILDARMVGIPAGAPTLHGIIGGGVAWRIDEGRARLTLTDLKLEVQGLTLLNGLNPIDTGRAIVTCNSVAVASSAAVPFSDAGDAEVQMALTLPSPCLAPAVFFAGITANGDRWFAVTGG